MAYSTELAEKVRKQLSHHQEFEIHEKKMFSGLCFLVNEKMCINVIENSLMMRFNPEIQSELESKEEYQPMVMKGKVLKGYATIAEDGFSNPKDLAYWVRICLEYNPEAKSSKKK